MKYIVIDLETNNRERYGRVANPWFNEVVAIGMNDGTECIAQYIYPDKIKNLDLDGYDLIVGHNLKFDLLYLWHLEDLQEFFFRGGQIWDTQYAEYCLTGQQHKYPALRDIAVNKYGCPERRKYIEDLLFNKIEPNDYQLVSDLPPQRVLDDVKDDVKDTEQVYLQQRVKAKELGIETLIELEMDSILATTEMEANGFRIERDILIKNKHLLDQQLQIEYEKLNVYINKYWK